MSPLRQRPARSEPGDLFHYPVPRVLPDVQGFEGSTDRTCQGVSERRSPWKIEITSCNERVVSVTTTSPEIGAKSGRSGLRVDIVSPWVERLEPDGLNVAAILGVLMIVAGSTVAGRRPLTPTENRA